MSLCERTPAEEAVLAAVKDTLNCHVAGGWVRDKLRGREPKDMDVWLVGGTEASLSSFISDLRLECGPGNRGLDLVVTVGVDQSCEEVSGEGRIDAYAQVLVGDLIVDLIVPFEPSIVALLNGFDFDVNQVALSYTQDAEYILATPATLDHLNSGDAYRTRPEETDKDADRTRRMWSLGFHVHDEVTPCPEKDSTPF